MGQYLALVKVLLKQKYKKSEDTTRGMIAAYIVAGVSLASLVGFLCFGIWFIAPAFKESGNVAELAHLALSVMSMLIVTMGMVSMIGYVYFNKDSEFLASLPIKPKSVFAAKISVVLVEEIVLSFAALIAPLITIGVCTGMGALYYALIPLMTIAVPVIPLLIISVLAIPIMYVVSFFRDRGVITTVAVIFIFAAFYGAYYLITENIGDVTATIAMDAILSGIKPFVYLFYPIYHLARIATGQFDAGVGQLNSTLLSTGIFIGGTALIAFLAIFLSSLFYYKGVAAQLENKKARSSGGGTFKQNTWLNALINKEFKEMLRTPALGFQIFMFAVLSPVIIFFSTRGMTFGNPEEGGMTAELASVMKSAIGVMIMVMFCGMNFASSTCITREGSNFYYLKILPVDYAELIAAKKKLYLTISYIGLVMSYIGVVLSKSDMLTAVFPLLFLIPYIYAFVCFSMNVDIKNPKLVWQTPTEAIKQNKMVTIVNIVSMFVNMAVGMVFMFLWLFLEPAFWWGAIFWGALGVAAVILSMFFHKSLYKNLDRKINSIE